MSAAQHHFKVAMFELGRSVQRLVDGPLGDELNDWVGGSPGWATLAWGWAADFVEYESGAARDPDDDTLYLANGHSLDWFALFDEFAAAKHAELAARFAHECRRAAPALGAA